MVIKYEHPTFLLILRRIIAPSRDIDVGGVLDGVRITRLAVNDHVAVEEGAAIVDQVRDVVAQRRRRGRRKTAIALLCDAVEVWIKNCRAAFGEEDVGVSHLPIFEDPLVVILARVVILDEGVHVKTRQVVARVVAYQPRVIERAHVEA